MKYLDPRADITFQKVFGEHPDLVMSFLNAMLPLQAGEEIMEIEYIPWKLLAEHPLRKYSVVDVRCRDRLEHQFITEIQIVWTPEFMLWGRYAASEAYVRQSDVAERFRLPQPVYSLILVNDIFEPSLSDNYYHHYRKVHIEHSDGIIDGLQLVFVELPKFTLYTYAEKKMQVLWLRYLTEINERTREVPEELLENPEIKKALTLLEESAFTPEQVLGYEKFWDMVRVRWALLDDAKERGREKGLKIGVQKVKLQIASNAKKLGLSSEIISQATGLSLEEIEKL